MPAESFKLVGDRHGRTYLGDLAIDLEAVVVDDGNKVIKLVVSRKHSSLPNLTLFDLTVAENGIYLVVIAGDLAGKSHAAGSGDALTQRTCGHINTGNVLHIGVTLKS